MERDANSSGAAKGTTSTATDSTCRRRLIPAPVIPSFDDTSDISFLSNASTIIDKYHDRNNTRELSTDSKHVFEMKLLETQTLEKDSSLKKDIQVSKLPENVVDKYQNVRDYIEKQFDCARAPGATLPHPRTVEQEAGLKTLIVPEELFSSTPFNSPSNSAMAARHQDRLNKKKSKDACMDSTMFEFENLTRYSGDETEDLIYRMNQRRGPPVDKRIKKMTCKVIVIGPSGAGKSSFIRQYISKKFSIDLPATVGLDCFTSKIKYSSDLIINLELWDIMGQDHYYRDGLTRPFYKNSSAAVLMFDVTSRMSFLRALQWKIYLDETCRMRDGSCLPCLLVGNKCDMEGERTVGLREVQAIQTAYSFIGFLEVTSKNNALVEKATRMILDDFVKRMTKALELEAQASSRLETSSEKSVKQEASHRTLEASMEKSVKLEAANSVLEASIEQSIKLSISDVSELNRSIQNTACC